MKECLKKILSLFAYLWGKLYSYKLNQWLRERSNTLYTLWVGHFIGQVGLNVYFEKPLFLQGGGESNIRIGSNTNLGHHMVLGCRANNDYKPEIIIGNNCIIGEFCHITAINKITIGDGLLTGRFVYIGDNAHGGLTWEDAGIKPIKRKLISKGEIKIGQNVWICDKVTILGGVTIGDNVIIAAGSVVTHDIPSNCMAAGMPARVIKKLE